MGCGRAMGCGRTMGCGSVGEQEGYMQGCMRSRREEEGYRQGLVWERCAGGWVCNGRDVCER